MQDSKVKQEKNNLSIYKLWKFIRVDFYSNECSIFFHKTIFGNRYLSAKIQVHKL